MDNRLSVRKADLFLSLAVPLLNQGTMAAAKGSVPLSPVKNGGRHGCCCSSAVRSEIKVEPLHETLIMTAQGLTQNEIIGCCEIAVSSLR